MIEDVCTYYIEIRGQVSEADIIASSPVQFKVEQATGTRTFISACTDQSGLIGLVRYLHSLGFVLLSFWTGSIHANTDELTPPFAR